MILVCMLALIFLGTFFFFTRFLSAFLRSISQFYTFPLCLFKVNKVLKKLLFRYKQNFLRI